MDDCTHGMDPIWCYLCRIEAFGVDPQVLWGIALDDHLADEAHDDGAMTPALAGYLRFLCEDLGLRYDPGFTHGEAARVVPSLLEDPASPSQERTLVWLCERAGAPVERAPAYGDARTMIRRLVALRGLRSA